VRVLPGAVVRDSIVMNDSWIGPEATLDRVIVDKNVVVGQRTRLGAGVENAPNVLQPDRLNTGITVVGKGARIPPDRTIGRNVVVQTGATPETFGRFGQTINSGETVQ
jgi:glucose-1-phosphate adenylyltransferase